MIDRETIDKVMRATDIVDVVKDFVTLRKAGVNYKGLCPFHDEKTPSFVVSPSKQLCKCFSCGKGGNAVHFIMEHEQLTYPEAIKWLGRKYGIEVKDRELNDEERAAESERESMFVLNEWARAYFETTLHESVDGVAVGMAYFRHRGFRDDIIRKFQLGYCLTERDGMTRAALRKGYKEEFLLKTGLCYKTDDGRLLDRYHGRVIFPVHTVSGKVVAFGGRILSGDKKLAKYVNSPESAIYSKSRELYGLFLAKHAIVKENRCYLVEGYTDVISMHQSGIENVVASSGTSLTRGQIHLLHRFTQNVTVLYDGDAAGIKASLRGIDMLLSEGLNVKVLLLPDGDDPDSFARKHSAAEYRAYINEHQTDFIRFKTGLLMKEADGDPVKRAELIQDIVRSIAAIPDRILVQMYVRECATMMGVDEQLVQSEVGKQKRQARAEEGNAAAPAPDAAGQHAAAEATPQPAAQPAGEHPEELPLARALMKYGSRPLSEAPDEAGNATPLTVAAFVRDELAADGLQFADPLCAEILEESLQAPENTEQYFLCHPKAEISALASRLCTEKYLLSSRQSELYRDESERLDLFVPQLLNEYKFFVLKQMMKDCLQRLSDPKVYSDADLCRQTMEEYKQFSLVAQELAKVLGERVVVV
ncbi:MAG: DNA primase [Alloprevotella sp.]